MPDLPPNHHADYPQFAGLFGYLAACKMSFGRGRDARFVADAADLDGSDHVLDIGCGPGPAARITARRGVRVTGLDPSEPMLRLAKLLTSIRRPKGEIDWVLAGAEDLTLADGSVTVCWSLRTVHHWPNLEGGLREVQRVLAPGGRFLAFETHAEPGATGTDSHGWTIQQADTFAEMLPSFGFTDASITNQDLGRRKIVMVQARKP